MTRYRQKVLLGILGLILLYFGGEWLWRNAVEGPLESRRLRAERLQGDIQKRDKELAQARRDAKELALWQEQSLPADPQLARSLYQAWLLGLVGKAKLVNPNVDSGEPVSRRGIYDSISFSVQGRGSLQQWTRFLYDFYRAGHLHQIRSLSLTPVGRSDQLDVAMAIEALVLPGTENQDRLNESPADRLAWERPEDYAVIPQRNFFGATATTDAAEHTFVTAIYSESGRSEVWLTVRTEDRVLKLKPGEAFQIGLLAGQVVEVTGDEMVFECDGQRWLVSLGESLTQAFALPPEF